MSKTKKKKTVATTFQFKGKPPRGKTRAHFVAAVFPNGAVGTTRAERNESGEISILDSAFVATKGIR